MVPRQATCVAIGGRGILIEGEPGTGKSALALALIDRGAVLVGDDSVLIEARTGRLFVHPHPRTRGLLEVRNLGLLQFSVVDEVPLCLAILLDPHAPRFIEAPESAVIESASLPMVRLWPGDSPPALKAELALDRYGMAAI